MPIIYGLVDPRDPARVRYVGFTLQLPETRLREHIRESAHGYCPARKAGWIRELQSAGELPAMVLLEQVGAEADHRLREGVWFARLRADGQADLNRTIPKGAAALLGSPRRHVRRVESPL